MLLTIYNLPSQTRYSDIKALILSKCGLKDIILDNLSSSGNNTKKVTVGLAEEEDAALLVRKVNGLFLEGQQLFVEAIKKKQPVNQERISFNQYVMPLMNNRTDTQTMPEMNVASEYQPNLQQPYYQQNYQQPSYQQAEYQQGYNDMNRQPIFNAVTSNIHGGVAQNMFANYGYPQQMQYQSMSNIMPQPPMNDFSQRAPLGFNDQVNDSGSWSVQNNWNSADNPGAGDRNSQQKPSRWDRPGNRDNHPNRDVSSRDHRRDGPVHEPRRDPPTREYGRDAPRDFRRGDPSRGNDRDLYSRDRGQDGPPRDRGGAGLSRDRGRDAPSRDRRQNVSSDRRRNPPTRDDGRDQYCDYGNDASSRARGRDVQLRDRNYGREALDRGNDRGPIDRNQSREAPFRRHELAPQNVSVSHGKIFGDHVTDPSSRGGKFSQQRNGSKPYQNLNQSAGQSAAFNNQKVTKQSKYVPPNKRPGAAIESQLLGPPAKMSKQSKKKMKDDAEMLPIRANTWRGQIAATIAKEIIQKKNIKIDIGLDVLMPELKRGIRARLENMFGENYNVKMPDMIVKYRDRYPPNTDVAFYNEVTSQIKENLALEPKEEGADSKPAIPAAVQEKIMKQLYKPQPTPKIIKSEPPQQNQNKIPSYPKGDKKLNQLHKDMCKKVFLDAESLLSRLDKNTRMAMDVVVADLCTEVQGELEAEEPSPEYKQCHERVCGTLVDELNKVIKINMAKRMLNDGPILVRIFCSPKMISRGRLAPVLQEHGITSLRKSEGKRPLPMYIGSCDTYDVYDKLCTMQPIIVDESSVTFKPFQLAGQKEKISRQQIKEQQQNRRLGFEDVKNENDEDEEYNNDDTEVMQEENNEFLKNYNEAKCEDKSENDTQGQDTNKNATEENKCGNNGGNHEKTDPDDNLEHGNEKDVADVDADVKNPEDNDQNNDENDVWTSENVDNALADFEDSGNLDNEENDDHVGDDSKNIDDIDIADVNDDDLEDW